MIGPLKRHFVFTALFGLALSGLVIGGPWDRDALAAPPLVKKIETESETARFTLRVFLTARLAPKIFHLAANSKNPRVVVDFEKASAPKSLPASIKPDSDMVRAVRVGLHKGARPKVRLVLDLVPGYLYHVEQSFRRDINSFILVLTAK